MNSLISPSVAWISAWLRTPPQSSAQHGAHPAAKSQWRGKFERLRRSATMRAWTPSVPIEAEIFGLTLQPGLAIAMCSSPVAFNARGDLPPVAAVGRNVAIAARGAIIGCARLTGVVTLGAMPSSVEHRSADAIRRSLGDRAAMFGPRLWVFEDGASFPHALALGVGDVGKVWSVPSDLLEAFREGERAAERRY